MSLSEEYFALRHEAAGRLVPRDVLRLQGPDAVSYLQGQCSQDVESMVVGDSADALLLSPQGKLDALVRVTRAADDAYVLDVDGGWGPTVLARLQRFRLRVKVELSEVALQCLSVRGPSALKTVAGASVARAVSFSWGAVDGVDLFDESPALPAGVRPCGPAAWEALRVAAGIPVMGAELDERTIPAEADLLERCVSFTKGCYTGQELVARLEARGNKVARHLVGLVVEGIDAPEEADDIAVPVPAGTEVLDGPVGRPAGSVTSAAWSPKWGVVALAYLHRRVTPPAPVELRTPGGATLAAEARLLPVDA